MRTTYSLIVFYALVLSTGCVSTTQKNTAQIKNTQTQQPTLASFCKSLKNNLVSNSHNFLAANFDSHKFSDNVFFDIRGSSQSFNAYKKGIQDSIDKLPRVLANTTNGKRWYITRFKKSVNTAKCTLRSTIEGSGVQIVEFHLHKTPSKISIYNWHDHIKNSLASESLRAAVLDYKYIDDQFNSGSISKKSKTFKDFQKLLTFLQSISNNELNLAIKQYKKLPNKYRSKPVYIQRLISQSTASDVHYDKVMSIFYKQFQHNKKYDLIFLDYFYSKKQYKNALIAITNAEKRIGKDSGLSLLKALTYSEMGKPKKFYEMTLEALNDDMSYESTYFILFDELIRQRKHKDAVLVLDILTKVFSYSFTRERFENDPKYTQLVKTRSFNQWIKSFN